MDYPKRLALIRDMEQSEMEKLKYLFAAFGPPCHHAIIKYLTTKRLQGERIVWRNDLNKYIVDEYQFEQPHVSISLRRMYNLGLLIKEKPEGNKKNVYYGLSEMFNDITVSIVKIKKYLPNIKTTENGYRNKREQV